MSPNFCEFHAVSAFSFLYGADQPETVVRRAAELGYGAVAITDRLGFYGSARAHHAAKECGIRASVGTTLETHRMALMNTMRVSDRIEFTLENLDYKFPDFPDGRGKAVF